MLQFMYTEISEKFFAQRLSALRLQKGVSAREMSLALGQNESYINRIENLKSYPSMQLFFYICEYLGISPEEFFAFETENPIKSSEIAESLKSLDDTKLNILSAIIKSWEK